MWTRQPGILLRRKRTGGGGCSLSATILVVYLYIHQIYGTWIETDKTLQCWQICWLHWPQHKRLTWKRREYPLPANVLYYFSKHKQGWTPCGDAPPPPQLCAKQYCKSQFYCYYIITVVHKIQDRWTCTEVINLNCDNDLQHSNQIFSQVTLIDSLTTKGWAVHQVPGQTTDKPFQQLHPENQHGFIVS